MFKSVEDKSTHLEVVVNDGVYHIKPYSSEIIETTFIPNGETVNSQSHTVILSPEGTKTQLKTSETNITYSTKDISISIQKQPFQISYFYNNNLIISEKNGFQVDDKGFKLQFNITNDEVLYGGGARALGMNRRGNRLQLYNRAHYGYETRSELMNFTLPIVLSSNQYMLHFDNAPIGFLDLDSKKDNTLTYETISGRTTYQVIVGDSWLDLIDNYTDLTGKQPLPPRWAFGNFSSRFGYHSQAEVIETIDKFIDEDIPVDAIILDLYWFGKEVKGTMGNLAFDRDSFPNPEQMIANLRAKNVETILITEPFILTTSNRWQEAVAKDILAKDSLGNPFTYDFYFGNTGLIDIYSDEGNAWFKDIYKGLSKMNVTGFWGDLGEPEVHPSALIHSKGTADEVHNIYGHDWAKLVYEASLEAAPEKRPFILMRAGYSGSQRYGLIPWSGDVNRTWGGLQSQPEIALQMGMQGLAYMHSDLGGFAGANLDDELYVRWLQYGVFQPVFRPHAQEDVPSEPIFRSDKAKALAKKAIELRYKLLPYNYNLAFENHKDGKPLMRPLFFEEDNNLELFGYSKAYLWGNDILVSPVLEAKKTSQDVYFPQGNNWFDFYSDKKYEGGKTHSITLNEATIPTFVRAGAFIPIAKTMPTTKDYKADNFELHYYFDWSVDESESEFYNDNGLTPNTYENDAFEELEFEAERNRSTLEFEFEADIEANYKLSTKKIELIIHNIEKQPKRIKIDGKRLNANWDATKKAVIIPITWIPSEDINITIKLKK